MAEHGNKIYDIENISIEDVIDIKELKSILNCFVLATGLGAICANAKGEPIVVPDEYEGQCPFCKVVRSDPEGLKRCNQSMSYAGRQPSWVNRISFGVMPG